MFKKANVRLMAVAVMVVLIGTGSAWAEENLVVNGGFETGDLTGWDLTVTNSGILSFQIPRVDDFSDYSSGDIQVGNYSFGVNIDTEDPSHDLQFTQVTFNIGQTTDLTDHAVSLAQGSATFIWSFNYADYGTGVAPVFKLMGAPTLSGVLEPAGTILGDYGSNQLASFSGRESDGIGSAQTGNVAFSAETLLKAGTLFVRSELVIDKTGPDISGVTQRLIWHMDQYSAELVAPAVTIAQWYKSYLTGVGDFTDAQYVPVDPGLITTVTGSHHWYQPALQQDISTPAGSQSQGYSFAFTQDRNQGVQSFARMQVTDPGLLGMQWVGEKSIGGIRIAHNDHRNSFEGCTFANHYPRKWDIEVLKTQAELGGVAPDLNINTHWKVVRRVQALIRDDVPSQLVPTTAVFNGARSKITTFIFPAPVLTEGVRITYILNCDKFERDTHTAGVPGFASFNAITGCETTDGSDFSSSTGIYASMFQALESVGRNSLPIDNIADRELTTGVAPCGGAGGAVYAAVDLGRPFDIDTNFRVFELISKTLTQAPWPTTTLFSADDVADPNLVTWAGSSSFARWIRFTTQAEIEFEKEVSSTTGGSSTDSKSPYQIDDLPQAVLEQARIYPNIQTSSIFLHGSNHFWKPLEDTLTDGRITTFINYSDYPVVCFDLNRDYVLRSSSVSTQQRRDLQTTDVILSPGDAAYWNASPDSSFTYSNKSFLSTSAPEGVEYGAWGSTIPSTPVRWVAVRGTSSLLRFAASGPKTYNFETQGGVLYGVNFAPNSPQVFTENSNWFSTVRAGLVDVSTFDATQGNPFSVLEDSDYGASHNSSSPAIIGDPFFVWDGKFDEISFDDFWGVYQKDSVTDLIIPGSDFPHHVWRVFRDPYRGRVITKELRAITIMGYSQDFYPTDFQIQSLNNSTDDPTLDTSWTTITQSTFTGVDTFNQGFGFTFIWVTAIETSGIRLYITDSVFPDESVLNQPDPDVGQANQFGIGRGPQTRLVSVQLFEEEVSAAVIQGVIDVNHAWGATASSLTFVPNHEPSFMLDNDNRTFFQSTGFEDTLTVTLAEPKTIDRFEWIMDEQYAKQVGRGLRTNAPATFTLTANPDSVTETVLTETDFEGLTFSGTLNPPITADTFTLDVTAVQGQSEDASSIVIHEFRLLEVVTQDTPLVTMTDVFATHPTSTNLRSTKITYAEDSVAAAAVVLNGIDSNNDAIFSERDFFVFWMWVNDISLLDTNFGTIRLGNSLEVSYTWSIKNLQLNSGWNEIKLQFKSAADRSEIPFQPGASYDLNTGESEVDFITPDITIVSAVDGNYTRNLIQAPGIRYFELEFRGVGSSQALELYLDDMRFIRNRFDDVCKFTPSLYLNNSETFTIYLEGLDISIGTVEFWMQPDWDPTGRIDQFRNVLPSIFKIMRPDGKFLTFFLRPGAGFVAIINDLKRLYQFQSSFSRFTFTKYETFHVALVWDVNGRIGPARSTLQILINGEVIYASNRTWDGVREGGASVMFGGEIGQAVASSPQNETATTFTAVPTQPQTNTSSSWALLENIKIYNYAKLEFGDINQRDLSRSQLLKPSDMIQISLDNATFHSSGADTLPLVIRGVENNEVATVYIRSNVPRDITGNENRDASLLVRWKTPLVNCD